LAGLCGLIILKIWLPVFKKINCFMKKICSNYYFTAILFILSFPEKMYAQNVGIGTTTPAGMLHLKGSADTSQLVIDANSVQSNTRPLIKLRNSIGTELLRIHSDKPENVFIGQFAGRVNNTTANGGNFNTFIGGSSGYSNSIGSSNTAIGGNTLYSNINGSNNTTHGYNALYSNINGSFNTALGSNVLYSNITGVENTAVGAYALYYNTLGKSNTATGLYALIFNTTGNNNTATGYYSIYSNASGINNTANGTYTLFGNTTGGYNTATGMEALLNNTSGTGNTANGYQALYNNTTGTQNTAVGIYALSNLLNSSYNTAFGSGAGYGSIYSMGWNNTLIGANTRANAAGIFNSIALGESAITTASNQARIGNSATTSIGGYVGWSNISDGRVKKNIVENVPGLAFINKLKPVTYNLDLNAIDRIMQTEEKKDKDGNIIAAMPFETDARRQKEQMVYSGFIAQDVEKAARELGYDFSGVDAAKNDKDLYGLRYADFVVPLVKAVQELSKQHDELLKRMEKLELLLSSKK
jgi:trimeric autotransporter adhesin